MKAILFTCYFCIFLLSTNLASQNNNNIDSIIGVAKTMPDDTLKIAYFGMIYERLMFNNPTESYEYAKKEYALSKKLEYKMGLGSSQLHLADYYKNLGQLDSAKYYYQKSYDVFKKANHIIGLLFINHSLASFEKSQGNYKKALEYANENIEMYKNRDSIKTDYGKDFNLIGAEYELIGGIHIELGNYNIALKETYKALKFFELTKDTIREADALMALGNIETLLSNHVKATPYFKKSYSIYNHFNDYQYKAYSAINLGKNYENLEQLSNAKRFFNESLKISEQIKNKELKADALISLASIYRKLQNSVKATEFAKKAIEIHTELDYKKSISTDFIELSKISTENKMQTKALDYLTQAINLATKIEAKENLSESFRLRSEIYKKTNDFASALSDYEMFKSIDDSIFNTTKSQQIEELRTIYDTEKKEQQITLQEKEITVLEQEAEISDLQKILLIGGLGLSFLVFGFAIYGLRQRMKRNKLEKEKVDAELAFKKRELTTHALHLAKKNEVLENVKLKAKDLKLQGDTKGYQDLIKTINFDQQDDKNWESFTQYFEQVHKDFAKNVKNRYPEVTKNELRFMALLKMNMSSKEIATILNISTDGIKKARQRLRKKMGLTPDDSLENTVLAI